MSARLGTLKNLLEQDPNNSRMRYMLAMEMINGGDLEGALREFRSLLTADPAYAAAYYHGGQTLERLGRPDEAREVYERGIEATTRIGDAHTRSEIQAALDVLA
jgi:tetratricopeptide (TPR) repeat protein